MSTNMDSLSEIMMTPSNQYLRPDFLSSSPATQLDSKKSPLALLAQTCSNIGADNPNNKPILATLEKSSKLSNGSSSSEKKSSTSPTLSMDDKPAFKPYDLVRKDDDSKKSPARSSKSISPSQRSSPGKSTPATSSASHSKVSEATAPATVTPSTSTLTALGYGLDLTRDPTTKEGIAALTQMSLAYRGLNPFSATSPIPGLLSPLDSFAAAQSLAASQNALKNLGSYHSNSPYTGLTRIRTPSGGTALVPMCRDPYCNNCQLAAQMAQCPSGCTQCNHERIAPMLLPGFAAAAANPALFASLYSPSSLLTRPNICSWMVGGSYCGKQFNTSEELLQHLRTHTTLPSVSDASSLLPPTLPCVTTAASNSSHRRSPISSQARFHPYKVPATLPPLPPSPFGALPPSHPSLNLFYPPPYGLFGQRMGPTVNP